MLSKEVILEFRLEKVGGVCQVGYGRRKKCCRLLSWSQRSFIEQSKCGRQPAGKERISFPSLLDFGSWKEGFKSSFSISHPNSRWLNQRFQNQTCILFQLPHQLYDLRHDTYWCFSLLICITYLNISVPLFIQLKNRVSSTDSGIYQVLLALPIIISVSPHVGPGRSA